MAILKGQFIHLDYMEQTDVLLQRFRDKGYSHDHLLEVRDQVGRMNRDALLETKVKDKKAYDIAFITGFNKQFKHLF